MFSQNKKTIPLTIPPRFFASNELESLLRPVEAKGTPEALLLCALARSSDETKQEMKWQTPIIVSTEKQAKLTNGRVTRIEFLITVGKIFLAAFVAALVIMGLFDPTAFAPISKAIIGILTKG